jgi:hypothetical protein
MVLSQGRDCLKNGGPTDKGELLARGRLPEKGGLSDKGGLFVRGRLHVKGGLPDNGKSAS